VQQIVFSSHSGRTIYNLLFMTRGIARGGKWCGCPGWHKPTGGKMNIQNKKKNFYAQQFLNYRKLQEIQ